MKNNENNPPFWLKIIISAKLKLYKISQIMKTAIIIVMLSKVRIKTEYCK